MVQQREGQLPSESAPPTLPVPKPLARVLAEGTGKANFGIIYRKFSTPLLAFSVCSLVYTFLMLLFYLAVAIIECFQ